MKCNFIHNISLQISHFDRLSYQTLMYTFIQKSLSILCTCYKKKCIRQNNYKAYLHGLALSDIRVKKRESQVVAPLGSIKELSSQSPCKILGLAFAKLVPLLNWRP